MGDGVGVTDGVGVAVPGKALPLTTADPALSSRALLAVIFGLIGYIWMRNRFSYRTEYALNPQAISMSLVWLVICTLGLLGPIANWAHGGGIAVCMLWGYLASDRFRRLFAKR